MRILLTTTRGAGHFGPMAPFADAFRRAGDDILFATVPAGAGMIDAAGYPVTLFDPADDDLRQPIFERAVELSELDSNHLVVGDVFVRLDARAAYPGILRIIDDYEPDLVLHEVGELAAPLAAEARGVPSARVAITLSGTMEPITGTLLAALDELRAEFGLEPDPDGERQGATPYLTLMPAALDDGDAPCTIRFREARTTARPLPFRWPDEDLPLVYLTFGSVVPQMSFFPDLYRRAIDGLAALPLRVLVTVGNHADPQALGPLPANVHADALGAAGRRAAARLGDGLPRRLGHDARRPGRRRAAGDPAAVRRPAAQRAPRRRAGRGHRARRRAVRGAVARRVGPPGARRPGLPRRRGRDRRGLVVAAAGRRSAADPPRGAPDGLEPAVLGGVEHGLRAVDRAELAVDVVQVRAHRARGE